VNELLEGGTCEALINIHERLVIHSLLFLDLLNYEHVTYRLTDINYTVMCSLHYYETKLR